uniref:CSON005941 protein n=1 Tax=Culicoides sonorensis TaxID=179676 RepID=A0A336N3S2_CULSO
MLSYMIPVEEHSPNRNLSLNLNNITTNNGNNHVINSSSNEMSTTKINNLVDNNSETCDEDLIDENTKLLSFERDHHTHTHTVNKPPLNGEAKIMKPNLSQSNKNQKNTKIILKNVTNYNCDDNNGESVQKNSTTTTNIIKNNGHVISAGSNGGVIKSDNNVETLGSKLKSIKKNIMMAEQQKFQQNDDEQKSQEDQQKDQNQQKKVTLKRVSFGSSKGSMVETVVYETPTPVSEYPERFIGYHPSVHHTVPVHQNGNHYHQPLIDTSANVSASASLNDSGIAEMQQEEVSFGSSKGSMVETVVYETPTPVSEYPERFIGYHPSVHHTVPVHQNGNHYHQPLIDTSANVSASASLNDSGIAEMQQEE